jgi:hypothetical protein
MAVAKCERGHSTQAISAAVGSGVDAELRASLSRLGALHYTGSGPRDQTVDRVEDAEIEAWLTRGARGDGDGESAGEGMLHQRARRACVFHRE